MNTKIDFVIPWVDGGDPEWMAEKNKYIKKTEQSVDLSNSRYRDWDNLKYWFRGVEKFAPWVNRIYFITWGHLPKWMNTDAEKLTIVRHEDYIPHKYLPTFSSHPIELNMHRIESLSEQFVYFNDDTFLLAKVEPGDFFRQGLPCDYAMESPITPNRRDVFNDILINNMVFLNEYCDRKEVLKKYRKKFYSFADKRSLLTNLCLAPLQRRDFFGLEYSHLPSNFLKTSLEELWEMRYDVLDTVSKNKFRCNEDVNQYIIKNHQYVTGRFYPRSWKRMGISIQLDDRNDDSIESACHIIENGENKMVCLNDADVFSFEKTKERINRAFDKLLPDKCKFEK